MNKTNEIQFTVDHEVRIRLLEKIAEKIDARFDHLDNKMDNQFKWTIGIIITTFIGLVLTKIF
jgi:tetrahydromethanopterin S-methyltransferase subunit G